MGDMTPHFSRREFACRCGCGFDRINWALIKMLEEVRVELGEPIVITSGCRCVQHNAAEGGSRRSAHLRGMAADVAIPSRNYRARWAQAVHVIADLKGLSARLGIGHGPDFEHIDIDTVLRRPLEWVY